jgi:hypothetical protein
MGNNDILERVHLKFCKLLLNLKTSTPSYMIYGELGRYHIEIDIKVRLISFWTKLCCGKESKLSAIMYKLCFQMSVEDRCHFLWLNKISNILNECSMSNIWNTQTFLNSTWLINTVKLKLRDQFEQTWHSLIDDSPKANNLSFLKHHSKSKTILNSWNTKKH